jgi:peptidylprolyl isomerase
MATAVVLVLSACTSSNSATSASDPSCGKTVAGSQSNSVKVSGKFLKTPTVTIKAPLKATKTERTVTITGKGPITKSGATVDIALAAYNGTTGKQISATGFNGQATLPVPVDNKQIIPGLVSAIACLPVGSRAVTTAPVKSAWGTADPTSVGLKTTDSVVFVADIVDILPTRANGVQQPATPGFPKVTLSSTGQPKVTIPKTAPPTTTKVAVLKKGNGATVASGDTVTVQYQGLIWNTGKVFQQTWGQSPATLQTGEVVKGFQSALVGQKVGSQVIAIIPPADGYGATGNSQAGIKGTDTIVFVVDILKTEH